MIEIPSKEELKRWISDEVKKQLSHHVQQLQKSLKEAIENPVVLKATEKSVPDDYPLSRLGFSVRAANALENHEITTVGQLAAKTRVELLTWRNFGKGTLEEVELRLAIVGRDLNSGRK